MISTIKYCDAQLWYRADDVRDIIGRGYFFGDHCTMRIHDEIYVTAQGILAGCRGLEGGAVRDLEVFVHRLERVYAEFDSLIPLLSRAVTVTTRSPR